MATKVDGLDGLFKGVLPIYYIYARRACCWHHLKVGLWLVVRRKRIRYRKIPREVPTGTSIVGSDKAEFIARCLWPVMVGAKVVGWMWSYIRYKQVRLIWVQSPSIMFLIVGKSAACAVTSALWGMRKGDVLEENLMQVSYVVLCNDVAQSELRWCAVVCPTDVDAWSCTRGWCAYVHHLSFNFWGINAGFFALQCW